MKYIEHYRDLRIGVGGNWWSAAFCVDSFATFPGVALDDSDASQEPEGEDEKETKCKQSKKTNTTTSSNSVYLRVEVM